MMRSILRPIALGIVIGLLASATPVLANHALGGPWHWPDGDQPRAYVTIEDYTPAGWPVLAATNEWATEPNVDMYYDYGSCGSTGHCVDVRLRQFPESCNSKRGRPFWS